MGVVLAMALETDVVHDDHLVVAIDFGKSAGQNLHWIIEVASEEFLIGAHDAGRGVEQTLASRVVAGPADQGAYCVFGSFAIRAIRRFRYLGGTSRDSLGIQAIL